MINRAIPKLRFRRFDSEWSPVKLVNISKHQIGGGTPSTKNKKYWNGTIPWIRSSNLEEDDLLNIYPERYINNLALENTSTKLIPKDSIALVTRVGVGKIAYIPYEYATSQDFLSFSQIKYYPYFILYSLYLLINKEKQKLQGTSIKGITKKYLLGLRMNIPESSEEQQLIGKFFAKLDKLIQLQQKKVSLLKKLKRGYLQKLFPRKGESIPRLRFKGFNDKWCCIKLGNIGKIKSGTGFPNKEQGGQKGIPFFKVSDMNLSKNNILMNVSSNYVTQNQIDNRHWKPIKPTNGAIIFAKVGAALMKNRKRLINKPFLIDNNLMSYSFNNRWNKHFGLNYFINIYLPKFAQTGALPSFNATSISTIRILLPSLKEQDKIGEFFDNISSLINLQHNKVICLRKLKKAYLQKMFC